MKRVHKRHAPVVEASRARLSDSRLSARLADMVEMMLDDPAASFPSVFDDAELEGAYRLLRNKAVTPDGILGPHFEATAERLASAGDVLVVHDTTEFRFEGEREGLGLLGARGGRGFYGHFALAVSTEEHREPYGVVGLATHVREERRGKRKESDREDLERESRRWGAMVDVVTKRLGPKPIHVMDREGDIFDVMHQLLKGSGRFVIRSRHDRFVDDEGTKVSLTTRFERETPTTTREANLSARKLKRPNAKGALPERDRRTAKLDVSGARVRLLAPKRFKGEGDTSLMVNVVVVVEANPPKDEEPIEWRLLTSEPIETAADLGKVIDAYRGRWVIEEYFKAMKTGCAYEKRQLTTLPALLNALAMFVPIAWHLLLLRTTARQRPLEPASSYLTASQLAVLSRTKRAQLPKQPTVRDALLAIARWGGWRKNNGEPGWLIIGRGFRKLLAAEEGWLLREEM